MATIRSLNDWKKKMSPEDISVFLCVSGHGWSHSEPEWTVILSPRRSSYNWSRRQRFPQLFFFFPLSSSTSITDLLAAVHRETMHGTVLVWWKRAFKGWNEGESSGEMADEDFIDHSSTGTRAFIVAITGSQRGALPPFEEHAMKDRKLFWTLVECGWPVSQTSPQN